MSRIYIAAPLSSEAEREFNIKLRELVWQCGFSSYLPQEDGGLLSDLVRRGHDEDTARHHLFELDYHAVRTADACLAVLDGRVIDEGVCVELGMAFVLKKPCIGFKTDSRSAIRGRDNLMVEGALREIVRDWNSLREVLINLKEELR